MAPLDSHCIGKLELGTPEIQALLQATRCMLQCEPSCLGSPCCIEKVLIEDECAHSQVLPWQKLWNSNVYHCLQNSPVFSQLIHYPPIYIQASFPTVLYEFQIYLINAKGHLIPESIILTIRSKSLWQWYINTIIVFGHYPSSCFLFKTQCVRDWILSPSSGKSLISWAQSSLRNSF
jgi:hypothetical protein